MSLNIDVLAEYLQDHLGGAAGAIDLLRRRLDDGRGDGELRELLGGIESHRESLEALMRDLEIDRSKLHQVVGWLAERMSQIKLQGEALRDGALRDLLELETLSIGVHGKQRLWRSLSAIRDGHPALQALDLDALLETGERQLEIVERHRRAAVARAFLEGSAAAPPA